MEAFRRRFTDAHLEGLASRLGDPHFRRRSFRELADELADRHLLFEATTAQRDEIADGADAAFEALLAERERGAAGASGFLLRAAANGADVPARMEAALRLEREDAWLPPSIVGTLSSFRRQAGASHRAAALEGHLPARAMAIAARETLLPGLRSVRHRLRYGHGSLSDVDVVLLESFFRDNARAAGRTPDEARLAALAAGRVLRGRMEAAALAEEQADDVLRLGIAALGAIGPRAASSPDAAPSAVPELKALRLQAEAFGRAHADLWMEDAADGELLAWLGEAAVAARAGHASEPLERAPSFRAAGEGVIWCAGENACYRFSADDARTLGPLAFREAVARLEERVHDPRTPIDGARAYGILAVAFRRDAARWRHRSFGAAVGLPMQQPVPGLLEHRQRLYAAVPGRLPAVFSRAGTRARPIQCRPVADAEGRHVGFAAFDALSGEFHGHPAYAVYDLDGRRAGWASADERLFRAGEPRRGFVTSPEAIAVPS